MEHLPIPDGADLSRSDFDDVRELIRSIHQERQEAKAREAEEGWTQYVSLVIIVLAVLTAIAGLKAGDYSGDVVLNQAQSSDTWAFYQAKSIKQKTTELLSETVLASETDAGPRVSLGPEGLMYVLSVSGDTAVWVPPAKGGDEGSAEDAAPRKHKAHASKKKKGPASALSRTTAADAAAALPASAWAAPGGDKDGFEWATLRVAAREESPAPDTWLLLRRAQKDPKQLACYLSNAPEQTPEKKLTDLAAPRSGTRTEALAKKYAEDVERYKKEEAEQRKKAEDLEKDRDLAARRGPPMALSLTALQIAIAMASVSLITKRKSVAGVALLLGLVGIVYMIYGIYIIH